MNIDQTLDDITKIILSYKKPEKIVLYGSRSRMQATEQSDIDLAVMAESWTPTDLNLVKNKLDEEVITPLKFDLVLFHQLNNETLKKNILEEGKVLYDSAAD